MEKVPIIFPVRLYLILLFGKECSSRYPSEDDFKDWLRVVYESETGLQAHEMSIPSWEKIPQEILRKAPDLEGLKVQAAIVTFCTRDIPEADPFSQTTIHYVYCNYYKISDEWYLHASSWEGGFWRQEPGVWSQLVQDFKDKAEKFKDEKGRDFPEKD